MSKHSAQDPHITGKALSFTRFWQFIASELGSSRLKVNPKASSIQRFVDRSSDPKDYLKNAIHQSYKLSNCHHLKDVINLNAVLDVLGETAHQLQGQKADDLLDIELLEEIAWLISERYIDIIDLGQNVATEKSTTLPKRAAVISLSKAKIVKANSRY